jgi:amino acid adenylation domain-containing protein
MQRRRQEQQRECVRKRFDAAVSRHPGAVAIASVAGGTIVSFAELRARAERVCLALLRGGVEAGAAVAIRGSRSTGLLAGILGIWGAGAVYVPIDTRDPVPRARYILKDSCAHAFIAVEDGDGGGEGSSAGDGALASAAARGGLLVITVDGLGRVLTTRGSAAAPHASGSSSAAAMIPHGVAYIMYTSGSTGLPKGCLGTHRGILNRVDWMHAEYPFVRPDEEVCCVKTAVSFVDSVWEMFGPLLHGVRVVCLRDQAGGGCPVDGMALGRSISLHRITRVVVTPVLLASFLRFVESGHTNGGVLDLRCLRVVACSGDVLDTELAARFVRAFSDSAVRLLNLYGSTEVAGDVTCCDVRAELLEASTGRGSLPATAVSIGRPITNCEVQIMKPVADDPALGSLLRRVPDGEVGEICVGGAHVALGYWQRSQLSAARFIASNTCLRTSFDADSRPDRHEAAVGAWFRTGDRGRCRISDGVIEFCGRADEQVQVRGCRVELGEVEAVLKGCLPRGAAAIAQLCGGGRGMSDDTAQSSPPPPQLVAFIVCRKGPCERMAAAAVRAACAQRLPHFMVPASVVYLSTWPMTSSGKIDRSRLSLQHAGQAVELSAGADIEGDTCSKVAGTQPLSALESAVADAFACVLGLDGTAQLLSAHDSFFELGGDSLMVQPLLLHLQHKLALPPATADKVSALLTFSDVVAAPTVAALASRMSASGLADGGVRPEKRPRFESKLLTVTESSTGPLAHREWLAALDGSGGWLSAASHWCLPPAASAAASVPCAGPGDTLSAVQLSTEWTVDLGQCVDGAAAWVLPNRGSSGHRGAEAAAVQRGVVIAASHSGVVSAVLAAQGEECWRTQLSGRVEASVCIVHRGAGSSTPPDGGDGAGVLLAVVGCYDGKIHFLDVATGGVVWTFEAGGEVKCTATADVSVPGLVWVGTHSRECLCLDVARVPGRLLGRVQTGSSITARPCVLPPCDDASGQPSTQSSMALIASHDGRVRCAAARGRRTAEEEEEEVGEVEGSTTVCWVSHPLSVEEEGSGSSSSRGVPIFAGVVSAPRPAAAQQGQQQQEGGDSNGCWLAVAATVSGAVHGLDAMSGQQVWRTECSLGQAGAVSFFVTPTVFSGGKYVLCPSRTGHLICLCCFDGSEMWRHRLADSALTSVGVNTCSRRGDGQCQRADLLIDQGWALASVGCADGTVLLFRVSAAGVGEIQRVHRVGGHVFSSPLMIDGRVMVGSRDNRLHCLTQS